MGGAFRASGRLNAQRCVSALWNISKVVLDEVAEELASCFSLRASGFERGYGVPIKNGEVLEEVAGAVVEAGFIESRCEAQFIEHFDFQRIHEGRARRVSIEMGKQSGENCVYSGQCVFWFGGSFDESRGVGEQL